jgi:hypothetical protein
LLYTQWGKAMEQMEYESEEMEHNKGRALSAVLKGANVAVGALSLLRYFDRYFDRYLDARTVLRWLGLSRRRSLAGSVALFGAGVLAGAGIAMFASPMSGQQTRQGMMRGFRSIGRKGRDVLRSAGSGLSQLAEGQQGEGERGARAGEGESGKREGEGERGKRAGEGERGARQTGGQPGEAGNANRGEAGKTLNR